MIKNVVYDIGGVLTDYRQAAYFKDFGYSDEMCQRLYRATMATGFWQEYDRGLLNDEKILDLFASTDPEISEDIHKTLTKMVNLVTPKESTIPWIQHVKEQGRRVFYLSNWSATAMRDCQPALSFLPYMDGGVFSYQEHTIKPNPEIYQILLDRYQLVPEETVFIDDTAHNLPMAEYCGLHTILYRSQAQAENDLDQLLQQR